jgi:hypothetical protein
MMLSRIVFQYHLAASGLVVSMSDPGAVVGQAVDRRAVGQVNQPAFLAQLGIESGRREQSAATR